MTLEEDRSLVIISHIPDSHETNSNQSTHKTPNIPYTDELEKPVKGNSNCAQHIEGLFKQQD
jgi:hypothetical protein